MTDFFGSLTRKGTPEGVSFCELVEKPSSVIPRSEATWESVTLIRSGLPRQSADWLAMTDFFGSLTRKGTPEGVSFRVFSLSAGR